MKRLTLGLLLSFLVGCGSSGPNPVVVIDTSMGKITAELYQDRAPVTVRNFLLYADDKHYDNTIFHRVIADFMIQGGGFEPGALAKNEEKQTREPIKNEAKNGLSNSRGTLAMARTDDPHSATSQFFINVKSNTALDPSPNNPHGYCVFGRVTHGMDVVDKIRIVETKSVGGHKDVPKEDVIIKSIRRVETKQ